MATNRNVRAEYDSLGDAANRFGQEAERIDKIAQNLARGENSLRRNNWVGQGADAFYKEMDGSVLPAFRRLEKALEESSQFIKQISKIFHDAEQEAAAIVGKLQQAAGSGGASGGAGGLTGGIGAALGGALGGAFAGGAGGAGGASSAGGGGGAFRRTGWTWRRSRAPGRRSRSGRRGQRWRSGFVPRHAAGIVARTPSRAWG